MKEENVNTGQKNLIFGLVCAVASVLLFWSTFYLPPPLQPKAPGPATFPRIILTILFLLGGLLAWQGWSGRSTVGGENDEPVDYKRFSLLVGLIVIYLALLPYLGFITASFLYLFSTLRFIKVTWIRSLLYSLIVVASYYLVFAILLGVRFPQEFFM